MNKPFKPLLAVEADLSKIKYPVLASPKLDGIRCIIHPELGPVSRTLKPIPNKALRAKLAELPAWLDGELIAGPPTAKDVMQRTSSKVMSPNETADDVVFYVFDRVDYENEEQGGDRLWYQHRLENSLFGFGDPSAPLGYQFIDSPNELIAYESACVAEGYEGIMLRDPRGIYKFGRSTVKEGILLKVKRFADMEGRVVGFVERMHNENEATKDNLGHTKRSSAKDGKVGAGTLGALVLTIDGWGEHELQVGGGFDDATRAEIWADKEKYLGLLATFKYQPSGSKDAPRFPVFKSFRSEEDV